jgi:hypothetical protein
MAVIAGDATTPVWRGIEVVRDGDRSAHWAPIAFWELIPETNGDKPPSDLA